MIFKLRIRKNKYDIEKVIQKLKEMSFINKIDFKLYRIDNEIN